MSTLTTMTSQGVAVYASGVRDAATVGQCAARGCTNSRHDARENTQRWTTIHGKVTAASGLYVDLEEAEACAEHIDAATSAVADVMSVHGGTWEVVTVTYDHGLEISLGVEATAVTGRGNVQHVRKGA